MDDDMRVQAGDVVRESGCDLRMTVVGLHLTDDGRTVAECRYPEEGHPDADGEGMRVGTFAVGMLRLVERPAAAPVAPPVPASPVPAPKPRRRTVKP